MQANTSRHQGHGSAFFAEVGFDQKSGTTQLDKSL